MTNQREESTAEKVGRQIQPFLNMVAQDHERLATYIYFLIQRADGTYYQGKINGETKPADDDFVAMHFGLGKKSIAEADYIKGRRALGYDC